MFSWFGSKWQRPKPCTSGGWEECFRNEYGVSMLKSPMDLTDETASTKPGNELMSIKGVSVTFASMVLLRLTWQHLDAANVALLVYT